MAKSKKEKKPKGNRANKVKNKKILERNNKVLAELENNIKK